MNTHETVVTPMEFVGGPRDGERMYVEYPPPPFFVHPFMCGSVTTIGVDNEPSPCGTVFRQGYYRPSNDLQDSWEFITVDEAQFVGMDPSFRHEALEALCARSRNPRYYKWRGED